MTKRLIIQLNDEFDLQYGYETGLRAVCEALANELGPDYHELHVEIVEEEAHPVKP